MYFYTIEVFDDMIPAFFEDLSSPEDIFKLTIISTEYDNDVAAQAQAEFILTNILTDDELEDLILSYNPDFFPDSVIESQLNLDEDIDVMLTLMDEDEEDFSGDVHDISIDGLPILNESDLTIEDYILNSYALIGEEAETLHLRVNIVVDPEMYNLINFDTNTTVH